MLEIKDLHVQFHTSDHEAVRGIDLTVQDGEIMGLVGESGSGKTVTAMMVSGLLRPEQSDFRGRILLDGEDLLHAGGQRIRAIQGKDICVVFQEPMSAMDPTMRIGKQVEECLRVHTDLSAQERRQRALQALRDVELPDPEGVYRKYPHELSGGMLQRVMIAAAIVARPRLLLADEPTTALDVTIQAQILALLKRLNREMGMSILFISHKLNEIMSVADRVTVLRKGKYIGTVNTSETTKQELSNMMVGRPVQLEVTKDEAKPAGEVLKVDHLCVHSHVQKRNAVNDVSFTVRAGEIVCIAGIDGNGQTELVYGLTGLDKPSSGTITLCGKDISHASIRHRGEHMSHIPEDRHKHGLVLDFTLEQNMVLQRFNEPRFENHGFINNKAVRDYANYLIDKFDVRSGQGAITRARSMSGGNQQKAIIAREVDRDKDLIVAVQPTRGLDVGAIEFIHSQLVAERDRGKAILLVSLELDEVMSLSDRILVMYEGEIVGELDPKKTTVEELGLYMAGAKRMAKEEAAV